MSRRGLVSKNIGPQGAPRGGAALMAKGDKPQGPAVMPIDEVASKLRVSTDHVKGWIQKGELRASDSGIKPYDFNKFKLDHADEIRKAQTETKSQKGQTKTSQKPSKKGFFSKFKSIFGGDKSSASAGGKNLAQENRKLKAEIERIKSKEPEAAAEREKLEEKVRYLESNMSRSRELESEVSELKQQLAIAGSGAAASAAASSQALEEQLEKYRQELEATRQQVAQGEQYRTALEEAQKQLEAQASASDPQVEAELVQTKEALSAAQSQIQQLQNPGPDERDSTIEDLRSQLAAANAQSPSQETAADSELVSELLAVQQANFSRFQRLHGLYQQAKQRLEEGQSSGGADEGALAILKEELKELNKKHATLLASRQGDQDQSEQLAAARVTTTRLKQENARLKASLSESDGDKWKKRVQELEQKLQETQNSDGSREVVEAELRSIRKSLQGREAQVQKIAGRLQENERALKTALEESARLTELLIERENKLRDVSSEYESEYRDKIEGLDRQVSGLQWKLSLREERIASLESEVNDLRRSSG